MYNKSDYLILSDGNEQSSKLISKLTFEHYLNVLSKKDRTSNRIVDALCEEYGSSFANVEKELNHPLTYFIDSIEDIFLYTKRHIKGVLNKPRSAIVKEECLIPKERITTIDGKMFKWLANKPGANFKEKLANLNKVKSTRKVYSYNIKENQVFYSYLLGLKHYFHDKEKLIESNPNIFGNGASYSKQIKERKMFIEKALKEFADSCPDVIAKNYSTPNNALISDENYSPIWRSYRYLRTGNFGVEEEAEYASQIALLLSQIIQTMIYNSEGVELSDYPRKLQDVDNKAFLYSMSKDLLTRYVVSYENSSFSIRLLNYDLNQSELNVIDKIEHIVDIKLSDKYQSNRGIPFSIKIDNDEADFFFDVSGVYECASIVYEYLSLRRKNKITITKEQIEDSFLSINDFSNNIYSNDGLVNIVSNQLESYSYPISTNIVFGDDNLVTSHDFLDDSVSKASHLKHILSQVKNDCLIYDVSDVLDEFTSSNLRNGLSASFPLSYPVWRSILAAESFGNKDITNVFDFVGDESYLSNLDKKNNLFVHIGPSIFVADFDMKSEKELQKDYLIAYSKKNNLLLEKDDIDGIILSGRLSDLFLNKGKSFFIYVNNRTTEDSLIKISFDDDLFENVTEQFIQKINELLDFYADENNLLVLPDYLPINQLSKYNCIFNKDLIKGASVIRERVKNGQVTWYERLPNLSLEVVKNGLWDDLALTKNREEENVIGKSVNINVNDTFILKAGQMEYKLPLRKSFIGESNKDFYVVLRDKSFPLHSDIEVKLKLIYEYGSKQSYRLIFTPLKANPYFKEIEAIWEEKIATASKGLFEPKIKDVVFTQEEADSILKNELDEIERYNSHDSLFFLKQKWVGIVTNKLHRLYLLEYRDYKNIVINRIKSIGFVSKIEDAINKIHETKPGQEIAPRVVATGPDLTYGTMDWEQLLATLTLDEKYLTKKFYRFPEATFGRYLATESSNEIITRYVFNFISNNYKKKQYKKIGDQKYWYSYPETSVFEELIDRLTAASAINHKFMVELYESDPVCAKEIAKVLISSMRSLKESTFQGQFRGGYHLMERVVELLIPFLFLRGNVGMERFLPGGKGSEEIIYCLKEFVRNYNNRLNEEVIRLASLGKDFVGFKTKLKIAGVNKPLELDKVPNEIYVLYLFLSGSEEAGKVTVYAGDK